MTDGAALQLIREEHEFMQKFRRAGKVEGGTDLGHPLPERVQELALLQAYGLECKAQLLPQWMRKRAPRRCFCHALEIALSSRFQGRVPGGLFYVQGRAWASELKTLVSHAWCVDRDLRVYDPTWQHPETALYGGVVLVAQSALDVMEQHFDGYAESILCTLRIRDLEDVVRGLLHPDFYPGAVRAPRSK